MVVNAVSIIAGAPHLLEWAFLLNGTLRRELFWSLVHLAKIDKLTVPHLGTGVFSEGFSPEALGPGAWGQACCHHPPPLRTRNPLKIWGESPSLLPHLQLPLPPKGLFSLLPQHNPNIDFRTPKTESGRVAVHGQLAFSLAPGNCLG